MLDLDLDVRDLSTNIFHNDCPSMVEPMKKISITKLLQVRKKCIDVGILTEMIYNIHINS